MKQQTSRYTTSLTLSSYYPRVEPGRPGRARVERQRLAGEYERQQDDYSAIIVKALADRLAEAFAREDWGYGAGETLSGEDLLAEKYRGIRPAFGYSACPDHTLKRALFAALDAPSVR